MKSSRRCIKCMGPGYPLGNPDEVQASGFGLAQSWYFWPFQGMNQWIKYSLSLSLTVCVSVSHSFSLTFKWINEHNKFPECLPFSVLPWSAWDIGHQTKARSQECHQDFPWSSRNPIIQVITVASQDLQQKENETGYDIKAHQHWIQDPNYCIKRYMKHLLLYGFF